MEVDARFAQLEVFKYRCATYFGSLLVFQYLEKGLDNAPQVAYYSRASPVKHLNQGLLIQAHWLSDN